MADARNALDLESHAKLQIELIILIGTRYSDYLYVTCWERAFI